MILYCSDLSVKKHFMTNSFICKKIKEINNMWDYRVFTDFLGRRDKLALTKSVLTGAPTIFLSLESSTHGMKYWRPYDYSKFNISHKKLNPQKTLYYSVFAEEILSSYLIDIQPPPQKKTKTLFISSNLQKIRYVQSRLGEEFDNLEFFGSFSQSIPYDSGNFHQDSQRLMSEYDATIVLENSDEDGFIQGNFLRAIKSGSVPILGASRAIQKKVLNSNAYIEFERYLTMSKSERSEEISKVSSYLLSGSPIFTSVIDDYLNFLKNGNYDDINKMIETSQHYRNMIFSTR